MWRKRIETFSVISLVVCLILCLIVLPVNADSNQSETVTLAPQLPAPPSGFNPLIATDQTLQQYGFPSRPSDPADLVQWEDVMSQAKYYGKPLQTPSTVTHGLISPTYYNTLWAGYVTTSSYNNNATYTQANAQWTQPNYLDYWYGDPALWTGVGGYGKNSAGLVQAGTDCNGTYYHAPAKNIFWVEDAPMDLCWESYPVITPGDAIYVNVTYGGEFSTAFLEDLSNGEYTSVLFFTPDYDGTSAEYIWEDVNSQDAPNVSGTFSACYSFGTNGIVPLYNSNYIECSITSDGSSSGAPWAWPTTLPTFSSGFTIDTNQ